MREHSDAPPAGDPGGLRGVITDWGGVLTSPIRDTVDAWLEADLIDRDAYRALMRAWVSRAHGGNAAASWVHRLERGECDPAEFERALAAGLIRTDGAQVQASGLLSRMFAGTLPVPEMYELLQTVRKAGFRTCLLSNSWGRADYPRDIFPQLFDAWVISAEVGMRKPEERIFRHAAGLLGLAPEQCVFIDDIEANTEAAAAIGMVVVHHREPGPAAAKIRDLLGLPAG